MCRSHRLIDFHVLTLGLMVSLLSVGIASVITFVPGQSLVVASVFGAAPPIIFVGPTVLTRTWDRKKRGDDAFRYFVSNAAVVLLFAGVSGTIVFSMLSGTPKKSSAQQAMVGNPAGGLLRW